MACDNIKQYFHQWCDKQNVCPQFDIRAAGKLINDITHCLVYVYRKKLTE